MYLKHFIQKGSIKINNLLKPLFLSVTLLIFACSSQAKSYYFSSSGSDSYTSTQAQSQATPWKSISKLNSIFSTLVAGDIIYFKRGEIFFGSIVATRSGSSGKPITFDAYGSGSNPVISGLITFSSWSSVGSGVYETSASSLKSTVNLVTLNGAPKAVGRYPNIGTTNGGYLTYESTSSSTSIHDNQLTSSTNWTGAEIVVRKRHFIMERGKITSHSGGTINFTTTNMIYPSTSPKTTAGTPGYGYFIQRDARTLDQLGEWYFNPTSGKLRMYFGGSPSSYSIKASSQDYLFNAGSQKYITLKNISFEGANTASVYSLNGSNITIQNCAVNLSGGKGLFFRNTGNILIESVSIENALNGAIDVASKSLSNTTIRNCTIKNTGMLAGMGCFWHDTDYKGISVTTNTALIEYNSLVNTGFMGIQFSGNNITIKNNFVDTYNVVKDDGGGIYTYQTGTDASPGTIYTGRVIRDNIILNGIGAVGGSTGNIDVDGIFLDGRVTNVDIINNTMSGIGNNGIYCNNVVNVNITGNTCFNNGCALGLTRYTLGYFKNLVVTGNIFYPKYTSQENFNYNDYGLNLPSTNSIQSVLQKLGKIDNNYFATPNTAGFKYFYATKLGGSYTFPKPIGFTNWKSYTSHDMATKLPPTAIDLLKIETSVRFEYNATKSAKTISLSGTYVTPDNVTYSNSVTLQPYTSKILIRKTILGKSSDNLEAAATATDINCFGSSSTVTVSATGGTEPYTGTGTFSVTPGMGSLKLSVNNPAFSKNTFLDAPVGSISSEKNYVLRFTTLSTSENGSIMAGLRHSIAPFTELTALQTKSFGTSKVDHEFLFTAPTSDSAASFVIELQQDSGTTYIDNIALFEAGTDGTLLSENLYSSGDFNTDITGINTWSENGNHVAEWDGSGKINARFYFPVKDSLGATSVTMVEPVQPAAKLQAEAVAGELTDGLTSVIVSASGGVAPYTGTDTLTDVAAGSYTYTVTDANGCSSSVSINVGPAAAKSSKTSSASSGKVARTAPSTSLTADNAEMKVTTYPNPTTSEFSVSVVGGTKEKVGISVLGVDGRTIYQTSGFTNKKYVFGSDFGSGVYMIRVTQGTNTQTLKAIKTK